MKVNHVTINQLEQALIEVNKQYDNNICWNAKPEQKNGYINFTLKVKDISKSGHRLHFDYDLNGLRSQKRSRYACWHVHGDFFEHLFDIEPNAIVYSGNKKITVEQGNWEDWNIGSQMFPVYFSESCEC